MAYVYFSNNPQGKNVGDCVVRALSLVLDLDWGMTYINLCSIGLMDADMPNSNAVWGKFLRQEGFRKHAIEDYCPDCYTVEDFTYDHNVGTFVVCTGSHVVAVIDGDYYDTIDSGSEVPQYYFHKEVI